MSEKYTISELKAEMSQLKQENIDDRHLPPLSSPVRFENGIKGFSYFEMPEDDTTETIEGNEVSVEQISAIGSLPLHQEVIIDTAFDENSSHDQLGSEYDKLWAIQSPQEIVNQLDIVKLTDKQKRIFAPPVKAVNNSEYRGKTAEQLADEVLTGEGNQYDNMWDPDYRGFSSTEEAAVRPSKSRGVTEGSLIFAKSMYLGRMDPNIEAIIENSVGSDASAEDKIEKMRTDEVLRDTVAGYVLGKIKKDINHLPYNIQRNAGKGHNHVGYEDSMKSHDYVAVLVLSYLDGTFDPDQVSESDGIVYREDGSVERGQHRYAANEMLFN